MSMYNLLATLSGAKIDYVLIGGLAVTLHGYQRVTTDVDVVLAINDANLAKFVDCATGKDQTATGGRVTWPGLS